MMKWWLVIVFAFVIVAPAQCQEEFNKQFPDTSRLTKAVIVSAAKVDTAYYAFSSTETGKKDFSILKGKGNDNAFKLYMLKEVNYEFKIIENPHSEWGFSIDSIGYINKGKRNEQSVVFWSSTDGASGDGYGWNEQKKGIQIWRANAEAVIMDVPFFYEHNEWGENMVETAWSYTCTIKNKKIYFEKSTAGNSKNAHPQLIVYKISKSGAIKIKRRQL